MANAWIIHEACSWRSSSLKRIVWPAESTGSVDGADSDLMSVLLNARVELRSTPSLLGWFAGLTRLPTPRHVAHSAAHSPFLLVHDPRMAMMAFGYLLAVATAAATVSSQSVADSYNSPATYNGPQPQSQPQPWSQPQPQPQPWPQPPFDPEQPSPDVCYQQHSASDCSEWRWCVWDPYSNSCSNARPPRDSASAVSSPEPESQQQPPPERPSPNVCSQMHSKVDCANWSFCQWNSGTNCCVNPRPYEVTNPDSSPVQPAALIATDTDGLRRPSPDVCAQQQEEDDCTLWSFCTWNSNDRLCSKQTSHHPAKLVSEFVSSSTQAAPPQPQSSPQPNPQPDFCGKQQSKAGCVFWLWCQWDDATHLCWSKH